MCEAIKSPSDFNSLIDLITYFKDEDICRVYLEQWLHKDGIKCPYCGFDKIWRYKGGQRLRCKTCKGDFTLTVGTVFEHKRIPLVKWFAAIYLVSTNKKGMSAPALAKHIGVTRKTSYFLLQKVRSILKQDEVELEGIVSSDETFVGGKNKNRHKDKRQQYKAGRIYKDKVPVIGMMEKGGNVKTIVLTDVTGDSIKQAVYSTVRSTSTLVTDEYHAYHSMGKYYNHEVVDHSVKQYVNERGYSTNNIESFWSHLKRMIIGVYHKISEKHLQKYCDELTFRFNTRHMSDGERFALVISKTNMRITQKQLTR